MSWHGNNFSFLWQRKLTDLPGITEWKQEKKKAPKIPSMSSTQLLKDISSAHLRMLPQGVRTLRLTLGRSRRPTDKWEVAKGKASSDDNDEGTSPSSVPKPH